MPDRSSLRQQAAEEAAAFIARLSADDASEADWEALTLWLEADPAHREEYDQAERLWDEVSAQREELQARLTPALSTPRARRPAPARPPWRRARTWIWGSAGVGAVAAAVATVVVVLPSRTVTTTYQTRPGERRDIVLADGSHIALNGGSRITVAMGRERRVEMADAEALFDVAHDASRPFVVSAGDATIRDVGTSFDIRRTGSRTRVVVARGAVEVRVPGAVPVQLSAGDALERNDRGGTPERSSADPAIAAAWRSGRLIYQDQSLGVVAEDLSRAFSTRFAVDEGARRLRFTGVLVLDDADAVSRRLQAFLPVTAVRQADQITLRRRP